MRRRPLTLKQRSLRDIAVGLLARREHSRQELLRKLVLRGCDQIDAESLIVKLAEEGLQSDERFAEVYTHSRKSRGYGPARIQAELKQRGIDDDLAHVCLNALSREWLEIARVQLEKKFGSQSLDSYQARIKPMRHLQNRGFSSDVIRKVLCEAG